MLGEFDDRVAAGFDFERVAVVELGADVVLAFGDVGEAGGHIQRGESQGGAVERGAVGAEAVDDFVEECAFEFGDAFFGAEDA